MAPKASDKKITDRTPPVEVITTHVNADFDALASMLAAKILYPEAKMVFPGAQEKNLRNFFLHSTSYLFDFLRIKDVDFNNINRLILVDTRQKKRIGKLKNSWTEMTLRYTSMITIPPLMMISKAILRLSMRSEQARLS